MTAKRLQNPEPDEWTALLRSLVIVLVIFLAAAGWIIAL